MILTEFFAREADLYEKNSFGQGLAIFLVIIGVLFVIGSIGEASKSKCIKAGCDNKQASGSSYCYLHKPYTGSSVSHSSSSYSSGTKKSTYDSYDDGYDDIYMDGDYDYDRYDRDSDYADGVDDAMDEYREDW